MTHPYGTEAYASSLAHVGDPIPAPEWGTHLLSRPTPTGGRRDAIGCYPLAVLSPDARLDEGLHRLEQAALVSVVLVTDDIFRPPLNVLEQAFPLTRRFKTHFFYDRGRGPPEPTKHHRYEIRRALKSVRAAEFALADQLPKWIALYEALRLRHGLSGVHAFPPAHHRALASLPGVRAFGAFVEDELVAAHIFVTVPGYAISHLAASSPEGYAVGAAYAVNDLALSALTDCELVNLGGPAGAEDDPDDGLARFKRGFSNRTAPAYLCGRVLDPEGYRALSAGFAEDGFFPAYRGVSKGEPAHAH